MKLLNVTELAALLDCSEETVELRTREGVLPGLQFGRSWVYPVGALEHALNTHALVAANDRQSRPVGPATAAVRNLRPVAGTEFGPLRVVPPVLGVGVPPEQA